MYAPSGWFFGLLQFSYYPLVGRIYDAPLLHALSGPFSGTLMGSSVWFGVRPPLWWLCPRASSDDCIASFAALLVVSFLHGFLAVDRSFLAYNSSSLGSAGVLCRTLWFPVLGVCRGREAASLTKCVVSVSMIRFALIPRFPCGSYNVCLFPVADIVS